MTATPIAKSLERVAIAIGLLLPVPLAAMQFTSEVNWGPGDFVVAGGLLFGAGAVYALGAARIRRGWHQLALGTAVLLGLALVWAELAVGIFH
ncbi:MAG: hypothetical protein QM750_18915 [Rubrivivax sp.]